MSGATYHLAYITPLICLFHISFIDWRRTLYHEPGATAAVSGLITENVIVGALGSSEMMR
jgi:hypothetical protein